MKWLLIKTILTLGVMVGGINYLSYLMTGKGMFDDVKLAMPNFSKLKESLLNFSMPELKAPSLGKDDDTSVIFYKWTDENGTINYTQAKPNGIDAEAIIVDPDTNLVQADKFPEPESKEKDTLDKPKAPAAETPSLSLLPNPKQVKELMQDAEKIQQLMDDRTKALEESINLSR